MESNNVLTVNQRNASTTSPRNYNAKYLYILTRNINNKIIILQNDLAFETS